MAKNKITTFPIRSEPMRIEVDLEQFQPLLDDSALSDESKTELLQVLWRIITEFVKLGYGVHPIQHACGQRASETRQSTQEAAVLINSDFKQLIDEFEGASGFDPAPLKGATL